MKIEIYFTSKLTYKVKRHLTISTGSHAKWLTTLHFIYADKIFGKWQVEKKHFLPLVLKLILSYPLASLLPSFYPNFTFKLSPI